MAEDTLMFCVNLVLVYGGIRRFLSTRGAWLADDERMLRTLPAAIAPRNRVVPVNAAL